MRTTGEKMISHIFCFLCGSNFEVQNAVNQSYITKTMHLILGLNIGFVTLLEISKISTVITLVMPLVFYKTSRTYQPLPLLIIIFSNNPLNCHVTS